MRLMLVVNPMATGTTTRARDVLAHALASGCRLEVAETKARGHAAELSRQAVADGMDAVIALGGDGTVNEVVNGLLSDGPRPGLPALGVVPGGSANVFARALGMTNDPIEATAELLGALERGSRRRIGLGLADARWFCFNAGLGLDADVVRRVESRRAVGRRATTALYVRSGVRQFFLSAERGAPTVLLQRDGAEDELLSLALVCNTAPWTYLDQRPLQACPRAGFDTGLDLFGLRRLRTLSTLRHLAQILAKDPPAQRHPGHEPARPPGPHPLGPSRRRAGRAPLPARRRRPGRSPQRAPAKRPGRAQRRRLNARFAPS